MKGRINDMLNEISALIHAVQIGRLDIRGDAEKFTGSWGQLVNGLNHLIDAFVFPITKTAAALDQLSKGEIPEPVTDEYKGDFNSIKDNLNMLIDVTKETIRAAEEISNGNLSAEVTERSENDRMIKALNRMIRRLKEILFETGAMIASVRKGTLNIRGNAEAFEGGWRELVSGLNDLIQGLRRAVSEAAAMSMEMELARRIQTSLLPTLPDNFHSDFEISATMLPAEQVGGDFYDIAYDRTGNLWFAIGDVSGHGVTPGLIMMMAQTVHTTVTTNIDCEARNVVIMINEILYKNVRERLKESHFMTFTALKYLGQGRFQHAGAHLSMIVFRQKTGECELIRTNGIYLNFRKDISRSTKNAEFLMDDGDILVLYTDGLTESYNSEGIMLDIRGFVNIVKRHAHRNSEAMKEMIMADVIKWCDNQRADDMTIVIVKRKEVVLKPEQAVLNTCHDKTD
jgi:serine phosphatase RsbU (regulator of sigma subunit)